MTQRIYCPKCKCELSRAERLMVLGVNRRMAGAARRCPQCQRWYPLSHKLQYVRALPVWDAKVAPPYLRAREVVA